MLLHNSDNAKSGGFGGLASGKIAGRASPLSPLILGYVEGTVFLDLKAVHHVPLLKILSAKIFDNFPWVIFTPSISSVSSSFSNSVILLAALFGTTRVWPWTQNTSRKDAQFSPLAMKLPGYLRRIFKQCLVDIITLGVPKVGGSFIPLGVNPGS